MKRWRKSSSPWENRFSNSITSSKWKSSTLMLFLLGHWFRFIFFIYFRGTARDGKSIFRVCLVARPPTLVFFFAGFERIFFIMRDFDFKHGSVRDGVKIKSAVVLKNCCWARLVPFVFVLGFYHSVFVFFVLCSLAKFGHFKLVLFIACYVSYSTIVW